MTALSPEVELSASSARVGVLEYDHQDPATASEDDIRAGILESRDRDLQGAPETGRSLAMNFQPRNHEEVGIRSFTRGAMPAREWAYQSLKALILSGRFAPAMRLTETRLVKELGISRTPIREALHKLEVEGVIVPRASRGFVAPEESPEEIEELFEIRAVLEGYALRVICGRVTGGILDELTATVDNADAALRRRSLDEFFHWNTRFHSMLHTLVADKPRLYAQMVTLRQCALTYRKRNRQRAKGNVRTVEGHRKILMALRLQHPDLCESVMREHIRHSQEDALQSVTASSP